MVPAVLYNRTGTVRSVARTPTEPANSHPFSVCSDHGDAGSTPYYRSMVPGSRVVLQVRYKLRIVVR